MHRNFLVTFLAVSFTSTLFVFDVHAQTDHAQTDHAQTDHAQTDHAQTDHAQTDHARAFREFGEFMQGTWTAAKADATAPHRQHRYAWTLDNKFVYSRAEHDPTGGWAGFFGIEPKSGKLAWWGFFADGSAGPVYLKSASPKRWEFVGKDVGPGGKTTRQVIVEKTGDAQLWAKVVDSVDGTTTVVDDLAWHGQRPAQSVAALPHDWEYLSGYWQFNSSLGTQADVLFEPAAGGMASVGHWMTSDGKSAHETVGWRSDKQRLVVDGYGESGNFWHIEFKVVDAKKCQGPCFIRFPEGNSIEGMMTLERVNENLVRLQTKGKDQDGDPMAFTAQWTRPAK